MSTYSTGPFTGNNNLTGITRLMGQALFLNEVGPLSAYTMYPPPAGSQAGFTFGGLQWDLAKHNPLDFDPLDIPKRADVILREILSVAVYPDDYFDVSLRGQRIFTNTEVISTAPDSVMSLAGKAGDPSALNPFIARVQQALGSTEGRAIIDVNHANEVRVINKYVDNVIGQLTGPTSPLSE